VDVLESELHIDEDSMKMDCVLGSQIIDGKMTIFIDLFELLSKVDPEQFAQTPIVDIGREVKILFAEDTPFFRTVVRKHLESAGYNVDVVNDGTEAWEKLKAGEQYDLILSDIEMPGMNGIELVQHIKKDPNLASIPVIALTALGGEEQVKKGLEAGFDAYELKLDKECLLNVVAKFVS
jgi:two-component system chemotaxis sensor kinase CheA